MAFAVSVSARETNVDIANNRSYIEATITIKTTGDSYNQANTAWYSIDNQATGISTGQIGFTIPKNSTRTYTHTLGPFNHNADGSLGTITIRGTCNKNSAGDKVYGYTDVYMSTIPRASDFTLSGTELGSQTNISISRASPNFTHTVIYQLGNVSQQYTNQGDSCSFTRPYSDAQQFGLYSASGGATITVITYNGGTEIGRTTKNYTYVLPNNSSTIPVINNPPTITEAIAGINSKFGAFIQNKSRLTFNLDFSARYGANINSYAVIIEGKTYSSSSSTITTDIIYTSGSITYTYKAVDTRGRVNSGTGTVSVLTYIEPQINTSVERTGSSGTSANVILNVSITPLNNLNDKLCSIKYKPHTSSSWYSQNVSFEEDSYTLVDSTTVIPIADNISYDFRIDVSDYFGTVSSEVIPISTVYDLMNFKTNGLGIGIGKRAEEDGLDIAMDIYYKGETIDDYIKDVIDSYIEVYDEEEF